MLYCRRHITYFDFVLIILSYFYYHFFILRIAIFCNVFSAQFAELSGSYQSCNRPRIKHSSLTSLSMNAFNTELSVGPIRERQSISNQCREQNKLEMCRTANSQSAQFDANVCEICLNHACSLSTTLVASVSSVNVKNWPFAISDPRPNPTHQKSKYLDPTQPMG